MGVHDYVCFVQQNGQILRPLEYDEEDPHSPDDWEEDKTFDYGGSNEAVIVFVETKKWETMMNSKSFNLKDLSSCPIVMASYSWDDWDFKEISGYREHMLENDDITKNEAIWKSNDYPGFTLVNFDPNAYDTFVLQKIDPKLVPFWYFKVCFENLNLDVQLTKDKNVAWNILVNIKH